MAKLSLYQAQQIIDQATREAKGLNHDHVAPEHLLLALVADPHSNVARTLTSLGVPPGKIQAAVEFVLPRGKETPKKVSATPRLERALDFAIKEAKRLGSHSLAGEHLLLGILSDRDGIAATVIENLGYTNLDWLRDSTIASVKASNH